jgi:hypothetical protein
MELICEVVVELSISVVEENLTITRRGSNFVRGSEKKMSFYRFRGPSW